MRLKEIKPGYVHCKTEEEANMLFEYLKVRGYYWASGEALTGETYFWKYKEETCYHLSLVRSLGYEKREKLKGANIVELSDFIELSAEEIIKWLCDNYTESKAMSECFGKDFSFMDLIENFSSETIVKKISDYVIRYEKKIPEVEWGYAVYCENNQIDFRLIEDEAIKICEENVKQHDSKTYRYERACRVKNSKGES